MSDILESSESKFYVLIEFFPWMTRYENNWHGSQKQNFRNQRERQDTVGTKINKLQTGPAVLDIICQKSQRRASIVKQDLIAPVDDCRFSSKSVKRYGRIQNTSPVDSRLIINTVICVNQGRVFDDLVFLLRSITYECIAVNIPLPWKFVAKTNKIRS